MFIRTTIRLVLLLFFSWFASAYGLTSKNLYQIYDHTLVESTTFTATTTTPIKNKTHIENTMLTQYTLYAYFVAFSPLVHSYCIYSFFSRFSYDCKRPYKTMWLVFRTKANNVVHTQIIFRLIFFFEPESVRCCQSSFYFTSSRISISSKIVPFLLLMLLFLVFVCLFCDCYSLIFNLYFEKQKTKNDVAMFNP